jgi:hypothetical protein
VLYVLKAVKDVRHVL